MLKQAKEILVQTSLSAKSSESLLQQVEDKWSVKQEQSSDAEYDIWIDLTDKLNAVKNRDQIFKNPEMLRYIDGLQQNINQSGVVGKSNSVTDVVKKVHQELFEGKKNSIRFRTQSMPWHSALFPFKTATNPMISGISSPQITKKQISGFSLKMATIRSWKNWRKSEGLYDRQSTSV